MQSDQDHPPLHRAAIRNKFALLLLGWLAAASVVTAAQETSLNASPGQMQWWQDARFGMFVCWGPVSLTGREIGWSRGKARPDQTEGGRGQTPAGVYDNLYRQWKPDRFDAKKWVKVAQAAGMKYMIFLVRHHDGYSLYNTKLSDYKSTSPEAAWRHDVMRDIADACHAAKLKLIVYYSQPDWFHPDYRTANHAPFIQFLHGQIRELLANYGRIDGLWFDGLGGKAEDWDAENLFRMARQLQPWLIINNRCGLPADYDTPEQTLGKFQLDRPWETCMTLGTQWSWKTNDTIKSLKQCVDVLVTCAVRGGNLALNTNPMPDGRIEPRQVERFREIGRWLGKYGQTIYATRGGPLPSANWGGTTHRDNMIFVHVLQWPGERLTLPPISKKIIASHVVTGGKATVKQTDAGIEIFVPPGDRRELDTIIALELNGPAAGIK
jgi:alpha-L-fucosidase